MYKAFVFQLSSNACWWDQDCSETSGSMTAYSELWQIFILPLWLKDVIGSCCPAELPQSEPRVQPVGLLSLRAFRTSRLRWGVQGKQYLWTSFIGECWEMKNSLNWLHFVVYIFSSPWSNKLLYVNPLRKAEDGVPTWCHIWGYAIDVWSCLELGASKQMLLADLGMHCNNKTTACFLV